MSVCGLVYIGEVEMEQSLMLGQLCFVISQKFSFLRTNLLFLSCFLDAWDFFFEFLIIALWGLFEDRYNFILVIDQ